MAGSLFRTKSIDQLLRDAHAPEVGAQTPDVVARSAQEHTLRRTLGPWLIATAFFIAAGFIRTGLGERIAYALVTVFGRSTLGLGYSLVFSDLVLAPMIPSNTARAGGVIYPILQSLTRTTINDESEAHRQARTFLTLAAYNGVAITSAMFLTSMVGNPLIAQLAASQGVRISWALWAVAASVPGLVSLVAVPTLIYWMCARGSALSADAPKAARAALAHMR